MTIKEFLARPDIDKYRAIVKPLDDGREMLLGFERKKKSSRHHRTKLLINPPLILDELVKNHKARVGQSQ